VAPLHKVLTAATHGSGRADAFAVDAPYWAARRTANKADIRITIPAVAKTNLSANKRRIRGLLNEAIALRVVLRHWYLQLSDGFFDRVHHHARPTDEILVVRVRWR
jgi:hypothetical protein